jgi:hypothetical protein
MTNNLNSYVHIENKRGRMMHIAMLSRLTRLLPRRYHKLPATHVAGVPFPYDAFGV